MKWLSLIFYCSFMFAHTSEIYELCKEFKRDFTLLNLGAKDGELAFSLSKTFKNAKVIMVEDNNPHSLSLASALLKKCSEDKGGNTPMLLHLRFKATDFENLSHCNYFDVVTVIGKSTYTAKQPSYVNLKDYVKGLLSLGWHTFIEAHPSSDLYHVLEEFHPEKIIEGESSCLFHFISEKRGLSKAHLFSSETQRSICVDFEQNSELFQGNAPFKTLILQRPAGLSLIDFKGLYGAFPTSFDLSQFHNRLFLPKKYIVYPHEMIVTVNGLLLASKNSLCKECKPYEEGFINALIDSKTQSEIKDLLKN